MISITGASSGIGCACAVELSRWGAKLALTGRNEERLKETAELCKKEGLPDSKVCNMQQPQQRVAELILGLRLANEKRRYFVTTSLTSWVQA